MRHRVLATTLMLLLGAVGCETKKDAVAAEPAAAPQPETPKKAEGATCSSNNECGDRLGCAPDKTCRTYKTIECMGRDQSCRREGRCTGSDKGCVAGTQKDCDAAEVCKSDGRCTAKDGRCVATSEKDCKTLCAEFGRCSIEDGKCTAASANDCKESLVCKQQGKCAASNGACVKRPKLADDY